eukprot:CAMPEP_0184745432 /NCGR_PEP_ID=MMETSP0315-20130426/8100_1 /TAXON_ID=101924 /ORGANISM="Rhodosorus marinus, Strain UTEX LB 2760" /LENGTH=337 /DNA_ID=CAMNT_0027217579 /DNA_START=35 /DNA_END=1048 /DNA_ORIENTATION=-
MTSFLDSVRRMGQSCTKDLPPVKPRSSAGFAQPKKPAKEEKTFGDEDLMKKKKLVTEYGKGVKAMIASIEGSVNQWTQLRDKTVQCKQGVSEGSTEALVEPMDALEHGLNELDVLNYDGELEVMKDYLARCEKVINVESKLYTKIRQEWDTKKTKLTRSSATGEKLDRLTLSVKQTEMKWDLHKKQLDENLTPLVADGPVYLEVGAVLMAKIQHANMVPYKENSAAFETILEREQAVIKAKLQEAGLGGVFGETMNDTETAFASPQPPPATTEPIPTVAPVPSTWAAAPPTEAAPAAAEPAEVPDYSLSADANKSWEGTYTTPPPPQGETNASTSWM